VQLGIVPAHPPLIAEVVRVVVEWARARGIHGLVRVRQTAEAWVIAIRIKKVETVGAKTWTSRG
jgi:hypothetical protein